MLRRTSAVLFVLLLLPGVPAAGEEAGAEERITKASTKVEAVLDLWRKAVKDDQAPPLDKLLFAMCELGKIPCRAAVDALDKYVTHKDLQVARCAARAMVVSTDEAVLLYAGSRLARRLTARHFRAERRELFIDQVYALAATGYLGAFDVLCAMLRKVRDGEVVALAAETLAHQKDYRAIHVLEDWLSHDQGSTDRGGTGPNTGRRRAASVGARPSTRMAGSSLPGTVRENSAVGSWPSPTEKWVRDAVYASFFELVGRDGEGFDSYDEYLRFMIEHRKEFKEKAAATEKRQKEQAKKIRSCP